MGTFFKALQAGVKGGMDSLAEGKRPNRYSVAGRPVRCPHCAGENFLLGTAQLNTPGMEFVNLGWANSTATTVVCGECGNIQWFSQKPEPVE
jgi:ribosomal protein S27E